MKKSTKLIGYFTGTQRRGYGVYAAISRMVRKAVRFSRKDDVIIRSKKCGIIYRSDSIERRRNKHGRYRISLFQDD